MQVTEYNVGRWCKSEDECIAEGIDFAAYERGVADAAKAFGRNVTPAAQALCADALKTVQALTGPDAATQSERPNDEHDDLVPGPEEARAAQSEDTRDAARYRWLREYGWGIYCDVFNDEDAPNLGGVVANAARLDAAIDAAIRAAMKGEAKESSPDGRLQTLADRIRRLGLEVFDVPECPQMVRDAIEWFAAELSVSELPT